MSFGTRISGRVVIPAILFLISGMVLQAQVSLYTPYARVAVPPGKTLKYTIEAKNNGSVRQTVTLAVRGLPGDWNWDMKVDGWDVKQLSLLPKGKKKISLEVNVPYRVKKGTFRFRVVAGSYALPLYIDVAKEGKYKTEFTTRQDNMQGTSRSSYVFNAELKNVTGEKQRYSLQAAPPRGWRVIFKPNYRQATSIEVEPTKKVSVTIEVKPPQEVKAGVYKIPVRAVSGNTSATLTLQVEITGTFELELTTPTGLVSGHITAGSEKELKLLVRNTGSAALEDIRFRSTQPSKWEVSFEPKNIPSLEAGRSATVTAKIKAYRKAVAGDYLINLTAYTPESTSRLAYRITVRMPMLMGWLGLLIIFVALGSVWYLINKYGRR
jgi:uncharacterized membrane protein